MPLESDDADPLAVALGRAKDSFRLPGGLTAYARGLSEDGAVEARARDVLVMFGKKTTTKKGKEVASRERVKAAVTIAQLVDHLAVRALPKTSGVDVPAIVLVALATAMGSNVSARRWIVATLGVEAARPLLDVSTKTLQRAAGEGVAGDDPKWPAFRAIAQGELSAAALWAMVEALGLIAAPGQRKRGSNATLTRGAMQALHGGLDDPSPFIAASVADAVPLRTYEPAIEPRPKAHSVSVAAQARAAEVDRATIRDWRDDPKLDTAYRLNQMRNAAWSRYNGKAGAIQSVVPAENDPLAKTARRKRTK